MSIPYDGRISLYKPASLWRIIQFVQSEAKSLSRLSAGVLYPKLYYLLYNRHEDVYSSPSNSICYDVGHVEPGQSVPRHAKDDHFYGDQHGRRHGDQERYGQLRRAERRYHSLSQTQECLGRANLHVPIR